MTRKLGIKVWYFHMKVIFFSLHCICGSSFEVFRLPSLIPFVLVLQEQVQVNLLSIMVFIPSRPPYHRQNRRRERPGARTRKALSKRESIQHDFEEGISVARDCTLWLPSEKYPLRTCECWRAENDRAWLEDEECQLFADDQELRRMGILYGQDNDVLSDSESTIKPELPPQFFVRPPRPKRQSPASRIQFQLPEYLAASLLSDNPSIAPWLLAQTAGPSHPSYPSRITIQHRPTYVFPTPQSLPPTLANSVIPDISRMASPLLFPLDRDDQDLADATWDFITSSTRSSAPPSEPETWILLSDDS